VTPLSDIGPDPYRAFAAFFLALKADDEEPAADAYDRDPRSVAIAQALEGINFGPPGEVLGYGNYGLAATLVSHPDLVIKLTGDLSELQIATYLAGKDLEHVAKIHGAWAVPGVRVASRVGWNAEGDGIYVEGPVGIIVVSRVERGRSPSGRSKLGDVVHHVKEEHGVYPDRLSKLSKKAAREKLRAASDVLMERLYQQGNEVCDDVAMALGELQAEGIYAVDVHPGNVGYSERCGCYQVFDVGVGSPPPGKVRVKKAPKVRMPKPGAQPMSAEACMESPPTPPPAPLAAAKVVEAQTIETVKISTVKAAVAGAIAEEGAEERGLQWAQRRDGTWKAEGMGGAYYVAPEPGGFHAWWMERGGQQLDLGTSSTLGGAFGRANAFQPAVAAEAAAASPQAVAAEVVPVIHEAPAATVVDPSPMVPAKDVPWIRLERDPRKYEAALKVAGQVGKIDGPSKIYELLGDKLSREDQEVFLVVLCDVHGKLRGVVEVARGQRSRVAVGVVDVFRPVLESGAESFAVVHNHPSGSANPSASDKSLTHAIERATKDLVSKETAFLDHVIVGMGEYYSFDERRLFKVATDKK
jgi:hypothetical protein